MRNIYLASRSKARLALLKALGLRVKVLPADVKEERICKGLSYPALVKNNALKKARHVSQKVKSGIIIAADTITVQGRRIFGKPKDLKDAKKMLKRLARKPQAVYTGIAVIDTDARKARVACEKTIVYMDALTDKEIDAYFRTTSPMDKAGSFGIQGKGAYFIRRVDGCFYNVVGLPLRRLYRMLKEIDASILVFLLVLLGASGCSTEYNIVTGKQETYFYTTEREVSMGRSISREVEKEYKPAEDPLMQKRVEDIGRKIVSVCDRKDINYHFKVLNEDEVNAVSLPGGYVYINKGLIDKVADDDELAGVIAHEVGHIVARHSIKKLQAMMGYNIARALTLAIPNSREVGVAADAAFTELLLGYSRDDELLADQLGARYSKLAGYNPHGMISFLLKLQDVGRRRPAQPINYFKTHPYVPDRVRIVKEELGQQMDFDDYINIEEEKKQ
jgi:MAF protein